MNNLEHKTFNSLNLNDEKYLRTNSTPNVNRYLYKLFLCQHWAILYLLYLWFPCDLDTIFVSTVSNYFYNNALLSIS